MNGKLSKFIEISRALLPQNFSKRKHFSFILYKRRIMSIGINDELCTHPKAKEFGFKYYRIHSELSSIIRFPEKPILLAKCTLINVRLSRTGTVMISHPCKNCKRLISSFNFKRVFYTNVEGEFEEFEFN
jgi:deoxycytidylate deaminase